MFKVAALHQQGGRGGLQSIPLYVTFEGNLEIPIVPLALFFTPLLQHDQFAITSIGSDEPLGL